MTKSRTYIIIKAVNSRFCHAWLLASAFCGLPACANDADEFALALSDGENERSLNDRRGRILIHIRDSASPEGAATTFSARARFAVSQGLSKDFLQTQLGHISPQHNLALGQCKLLNPSSGLNQVEALGEKTTPFFPEKSAEDPKATLDFIDIGPVTVDFDRQRKDLRLALVPDLLPYMTGVEYVERGEFPSSFEPSNVRISASGAPDFPGLSARIPLPTALDLEATLRPGREIELTWQAAPRAFAEDKAGVLLQLQERRGDAASTTLCWLPDSGEAVVSLALPEPVGPNSWLANRENQEVQVELSRTTGLTTLQSGVPVEILIERSESAEL